MTAIHDVHDGGRRRGAAPRIAFCLQSADLWTGATRSLLLYLRFSRLPRDSVRLMVPAARAETGERLLAALPAGVAVAFIGKGLDHVPFRRWARSPRRIVRRVAYRLSFALRFAALLRREGIDTVFINGLRGSTEAVVGRLCGRRLVWCVRNFEGAWPVAAAGRPTIPTLVRGLRVWLHLALADAVVVLSQEDRDRVRRSRLGRRKPVAVVPNGVDPDALAVVPAGPPAEDGGRVIVCGVMSTIGVHKGLHEFLEVARRITDECPAVSFAVYGRTNEALMSESAVRDLAGALLRRGSLEFRGYSQVLTADLRRCHVLFFPSREEGAPRSVLDAMVAGLPVVATRVGGIPEQVEDGVSGFLVPPADTEAMYRALLRLLRDPELRASMGRRGRLQAETLLRADRLAAILDDVLLEGRCRAGG